MRLYVFFACVLTASEVCSSGGLLDSLRKFYKYPYCILSLLVESNYFQFYSHSKGLAGSRDEHC